MAKSGKAKSTLSPASRAEKLSAFHVCGVTEMGQAGLVPVLVMQGGGALGAYQAGVYEAMHMSGIEPEWVIGTSIGAINAGIITGNPPERRLEALREFWQRMSRDNRVMFAPFNFFPAAATMMFGLPGFFTPQPFAALGLLGEKSPEQAAFYSTSPLEKTLSELIDIELLNRKAPRLTVGAVEVEKSVMRYFDSRDQELTLAHVMASGALPPAFPPVRIGDCYYWDGGILSNTPIEAVFDDMNRRSSLVFSVEVWHGNGPVPVSVNDAISRHKDIQYASRDEDHIRRQQQLHRLRHVITELVSHLPDDKSDLEEVVDLASYGCTTRMHIVRLSAPIVSGEDHTKDIDFSPQGVEARWTAGREDTLRMIESRPWTETSSNPLDAVIVHHPPPQIKDSVTGAA